MDGAVVTVGDGMATGVGADTAEVSAATTAAGDVTTQAAAGSTVAVSTVVVVAAAGTGGSPCLEGIHGAS